MINPIVSTLSSLILLLNNIIGFVAPIYFAVFTSRELRPYFAAHDMDAESRQAYMAFVFLCFSPVAGVSYLIALVFLGVYWGVTESAKRKTRWVVVLAVYYVVINLACIALSVATAKVAWGWWVYFDGHGEPDLARNCHALAGVMIAGLSCIAFGLFILAINLCFYVLAVCCCWCCSGSYGGKEKATVTMV